VGIYSFLVKFELDADDTKMNDDTFVQKIRTRIRNSIRITLEDRQGIREIEDAKIDVDISTERPSINPL
jgi:hypothetical protein